MDSKLKNEIVNKIKRVINEYLTFKMDVKYLRKYFKHNSSFKNLLKDINYIGKKDFDNVEKYEKEIRRILNDIIDDKEATIKDKKVSESVILNFNDFIKNNNI
jgi:hypothetical protein